RRHTLGEIGGDRERPLGAPRVDDEGDDAAEQAPQGLALRQRARAVGGRLLEEDEAGEIGVGARGGAVLARGGRGGGTPPRPGAAGDHELVSERGATAGEAGDRALAGAARPEEEEAAIAVRDARAVEDEPAEARERDREGDADRG